MILLCVKKIQCNEISFLFCVVEPPTQYSPEVGKTEAKTFYTKKSRLVQMNFFVNKYNNLSHFQRVHL